MDADAALGALMMQLQNAAGVQPDRDERPDGDGDGGRGPAAGGDDDSDSGSDIMAELRALKRDPDAENAAAAAAANAPVSRAAAAANTAALLLHQVTRRHPLFLSADAAAARRRDQQRFAQGEMDAEEATQWELNESLFASQEAAVAAETSTAAAPNGTASLRPASAAAIEALARVNTPETRRDPSSWRALLAEMRELPLSRTRPLWQRCIALFPRQTEIVDDYLKREIEAEAAVVRSDDAVTARLRILDAFHRHLPLCITSAKLHLTFVKYAAETANVDDFTLRESGETAIRRVGRCLDAAPLWRYVIDDVMPRFRRQPGYVDRVRSLYHAWLTTPMDGLEDAGFAYGAFETSLRAHQRIRLESKLEERFKRARSLYFDKAKLWAAIDPMFLPGVAVRPDGTMSQAAVRQWRAWACVLAEEADAAKQGLPPVAHSHRLAFILKQRLACFPDVQLCWLDLARHAAAANLNDLADAVLSDATSADTAPFPHSVLLRQQHAQLLSGAMSSPERANNVFVSLLRGLIAAVNAVLNRVRTSNTPKGRPTQRDLAELNELKADMAAACCAWQSWARHALREHGHAHARAVAEHAVRKCGMGRSATFMRHWLDLELQHAGVATGPSATPVSVVAASEPAVILRAWLRGVTQSAVNAKAALEARLSEVHATAVEAAHRCTRRRGGHRSEQDQQQGPASLSRGQLAAVADTVIEHALRAAAMVQSAACLVPEQAAADDAVREAFVVLVRDVTAGRQTAGDAAACVTVLHAAGVTDELRSALDHACRRLPPLAAIVRDDLVNLPRLLPIVSEWVAMTAADAIRSADSAVTDANIATLLRSRWATLSTRTLTGGTPAELASRIAHGGLVADDCLVESIVGAIDAVVPTKTPFAAATQTSSTDCSVALAAALRRVVPVPGTWNSLLGPPHGSARAMADGTDAAVLAALVSGGPQSALRAHRAANRAGDDEQDATVAVLAPHAAALGTPTEVDTRRWTRMPEVPANTAAIAGSAAVRSFRNQQQSSSSNQQNRGVDSAIAGGVRIVSADDVLAAEIEKQELVLPSADDDEAVARRKALEERGRTMRHVYTAKRVATSGAGSSLVLASMPPQQLQQEQLAAALTRLIRALPSAAGCVGKFDPFIADRISDLYAEHAAETSSEDKKKTGNVPARPLVPSTEFVMRSLASATTLTLRDL